MQLLTRRRESQVFHISIERIKLWTLYSLVCSSYHIAASSFNITNINYVRAPAISKKILHITFAEQIKFQYWSHGKDKLRVNIFACFFFLKRRREEENSDGTDRDKKINEILRKGWTNIFQAPRKGQSNGGIGGRGRGRVIRQARQCKDDIGASRSRDDPEGWIETILFIPVLPPPLLSPTLPPFIYLTIARRRRRQYAARGFL